MFYTLYAIVYTHFEHFKTVLFFDIVQVKLATVLLNLSLICQTLQCHWCRYRAAVARLVASILSS